MWHNISLLTMKTESDGGTLQMPYVPNGTKGHKLSKSLAMKVKPFFQVYAFD